MVRRFANKEHRLVVSGTETLREAVAAKEAQVAMMRELRRQREEQQE